MSGREDTSEAALKRRIAELEAQLAEERRQHRIVREVLEHAPVCVQAYDADGVCTYMNTAQERFLGVESRDISIGVFNALSDEGMRASGIAEFFERAYEGETVHIPEMEVDLQEFGSKWDVNTRIAWFEEIIYPVEGEHGVEAVVSVHWDITSRKEMERALIAAQRHDVVAQLAGGVAHDFNNMLAGILGNASLALLPETNVDDRAQSLRDIQSAAEQAAELTHQLLAYAGRGRFQVKDIDLSSLLTEVGRLVEVSLPKGVVVRRQLAMDLPVIRGDVAQVRQVVLNLIRNAGDAIGDQPGTISVRTSRVEADGNYLEQSMGAPSLEPGLYCELEVSDTGCGMDADTQRQMFDPFFTTKDQGHGLGLAAVLGIMKAHRAAIRVYSEHGGGTTIKLLFPAAGAVAPNPERPDTALPDVAELTVLVVDDERVVRNFVRRILHKKSYRVHVASNGPEALDTYERHGKEIDLVLLDLTMPGMSGHDVFRELRRRDPSVRVLLMSGYSREDSTASFAGKGLAGFMQKPFTVQQLLTELSTLAAD